MSKNAWKKFILNHMNERRKNKLDVDVWYDVYEETKKIIEIKLAKAFDESLEKSRTSVANWNDKENTTDDEVTFAELFALIVKDFELTDIA